MQAKIYWVFIECFSFFFFFCYIHFAHLHLILRLYNIIYNILAIKASNVPAGKLKKIKQIEIGVSECLLNRLKIGLEWNLVSFQGQQPGYFPNGFQD